MFQNFQQKFRQRIGDLLIDGVIYVSDKVQTLFRLNGQTTGTTGSIGTTDVLTLVRTGVDTYQINFMPGRLDRGVSLTVDASQTVLAPLGGGLTLGVSTGAINFASNTVVPLSGTRFGPNAGSGTGQMIFGGQPSAPTGEFAVGSVEVRGVHAGTTATTNIVGANVLVRAGDGASGSAGAASGGNLRLSAGTKFGTGVAGQVQLGYDSTTTSRVTVRNTILALNGYTTTAAAATTTELPVAGDYGIHKNSSTSAVHLCFNDAGTIKSVQLT